MSKSMTDLDLAMGDRIELIEMRNDPEPIKPGTQGTIESIMPLFGKHQVIVEWDDGRGLMLILPDDKYRLLERS